MCLENFFSFEANSGISEEEYLAPLRLEGGATPYEGQLQVLYNGRWGKVCGDGFDLAAVDIACSQLGQQCNKNHSRPIYSYISWTGMHARTVVGHSCVLISAIF